MNTVTLNFRADDQQLVRTGSEKFAANTVNYIRAVFDLGDGWDGFDSVRAVWATDFAKIATVLDSDGACAVPWEVLKRVDTVMVNLVGSIADGDVLTDRLTTYKVKALDVNGRTNIAGTETAEITPSQFEQFVEAVKEEVGKVKDISDVRLNDDYTLTFIFSDETEWTTPIPIRGEQGETGNGIASAVLNADYTLTLNFTDGTHYTTPPIRGSQGETGNGIDRIEKTGTVGSVDTYTIYFTDGTTTTFDVTNGEVTKAELEELLPTESASGSIVSFPDGQSVFPMKSLKVNLEPIQDLHGYDKPWSGGAGANIWGGERLAEDVSEALGISYDAVNKTIRINIGGAGDDASIIFSKGITFKENTRYTLITDGTASGLLNMMFKYTDGTTDRSLGRNPQIGAYVSAEGKTVANLVYRSYRGSTVLNYEKCGIFEGVKTVADFTPYSNICPIYGHDSVGAVVSPTQDAEDGTTYTADLPQTVYGGWVDLVSGEGEIDRVTHNYTANDVIRNGGISDLSTSDNQITRVSYNKSRNPTIPIAPQPTDAEQDKGRFSHGDYFATNSGWSSKTYHGYAAGDSSHIFIKCAPNETAINAYLTEQVNAGTPVQMVIPLATPIPFNIDPQVISTLRGRNNVWSEQGDVEVTYKADIQLYIDKKTNELAVAISAL